MEVFHHSIRIYGAVNVQGDIFFVSTTIHLTKGHSGDGIFIRPLLDSGARGKKKERKKERKKKKERNHTFRVLQNVNCFPG